MSALTEFVIDTWAALSHKLPMREGVAGRAAAITGGWAPADWTGEENRRRLTAYSVLAAYDENVSRHFIDASDEDRADNREYGDAALLIDTVMSALLGDEQTVVVPGAEHHDPDFDDDADAPEEPTPDPDTGVVDPKARARYVRDLERHQKRLADNAAAARAVERQEFLQTWAEDIHLALRMVDSERTAVRSGDTTWLLAWDSARQKVVPTVMDPGFYFPVLPDDLDGYAYPTRVHFAWELPGEDFPDGKTRVRRITYQLTRLHPLVDEDALLVAENDDDRVAAFTLPADTEWGSEVYGVGEDRVTVPVVMRRYPWNTEPTRDVCTVTDATWLLDDLNDAHRPDAFSMENAEFRFDTEGVPIDDYDLGIDFLPVVHIPNTPPAGGHFGQSSLNRVVQILDDLQNADTDTQAAAATTGSPIIAIHGSATVGDNVLTGQRGRQLKVAPGEVWKLGENGGATAIDTSPNLAATREYVQSLLDRLLVNARLPAAVVGTVKPSEVPSGFAMELSFGPLTSMIRTMRLVRGVKYPLMLKMVQRLYQANGILPEGPTPRAIVQLGAFLPTDRSAVLAEVKTAVTEGLISLETGVRMLLEAGFPVDDVAEEVARIEHRAFEAAVLLANATNDNAAVREFLGLPPQEDEQETAPLVEVDPVTGEPVVVVPGEPVAGGTGTGVPSPSDSGAGAGA